MSKRNALGGLGDVDTLTIENTDAITVGQCDLTKKHVRHSNSRHRRLYTTSIRRNFSEVFCHLVACLSVSATGCVVMYAGCHARHFRVALEIDVRLDGQTDGRQNISQHNLSRTSNGNAFSSLPRRYYYDTKFLSAARSCFNEITKLYCCHKTMASMFLGQ